MLKEAGRRITLPDANWEIYKGMKKDEIVNIWINIVFACCCCNKLPQTQWLKTTNFFITVLEIRRLKLVSLG